MGLHVLQEVRRDRMGRLQRWRQRVGGSRTNGLRGVSRRVFAVCGGRREEVVWMVRRSSRRRSHRYLGGGFELQLRLFEWRKPGFRAVEVSSTRLRREVEELERVLNEESA